MLPSNKLGQQRPSGKRFSPDEIGRLCQLNRSGDVDYVCEALNRLPRGQRKNIRKTLEKGYADLQFWKKVDGIWWGRRYLQHMLTKNDGLASLIMRDTPDFFRPANRISSLIDDDDTLYAVAVVLRLLHQRQIKVEVLTDDDVAVAKSIVAYAKELDISSYRKSPVDILGDENIHCVQCLNGDWTWCCSCPRIDLPVLKNM